MPDETYRESKSMGLLVRPDGVVCLRNYAMNTNQADAKASGVPLVFPATHEFSQDFLLKHTMDGTVQMDANRIVLTFGNGRAVYKIHDEWQSTGYWGELVDAEYFDVDPVAEAVTEAKTEHVENHEGGFGECELCEPTRTEARGKVLARAARRAKRTGSDDG